MLRMPEPTAIHGLRLLETPEGFQVVENQIDAWVRSQGGHEKWAELARKCTNYFEGEQWSEIAKKILEDEGRPCLTNNEIAPLMRLLLGYFRQNRYDSTFMPGNDGSGTQEIAESLTATLKQIREVNQSDWNDAEVFQDGLFTGRGYWDVRLDFSRNPFGEIRERVVDPFSVYVDPEANSYDPEKWNFVIENRWLSPTDIFLMYGDKAANEINALGQGTLSITGSAWADGSMEEITPERYFGLSSGQRSDWDSGIDLFNSPFHHINRHRKLIRVLDRQHRQMKRVQYFIDLETGQEKIIPGAWEREKIQRVLQYCQMRGLGIDIREGMKKVVRWTATAGDKVLWDDWSPYSDHFTIIPFFTYFRRGKTKGAIEDLLDPQDEVNKRKSALLHIIMTTANSGWMSEKGSLEEDMARALEEEGARPGIHIEYNEGFEAPQRITPSVPPTALRTLIMDEKDNIRRIAGINDSAMGDLDSVQSGRAIQSRQRQAIVGAEVYFDNFSRSRELKDRVKLNLIQNFYTEPRVFRVRGESEDQEITINRRMASGEIVNNVTLGNYQVAIDSTPVSATFMQGQFEEALQMIEKGIPIPPDILVDLSSLPMKEKIKQRFTDQVQFQNIMQQLQILMQQLQIGMQPGTPVPQVVSAGEPAVVMPQSGPQGMPTAPAPMPLPGPAMMPPPQGMPMPPQGQPVPPEARLMPTTAYQLGQ